jgi:ATP-dependent Lon protease
MSAVVVRDEKTAEAIIKSAELGASYLGTFLRSDTKPGLVIETPELITNMDQVHKTGTFAQVQSILRTDGGLQLLLMGHRRITLDAIKEYGPPVTARVTHWNKSHIAVESSLVKAYRNEIILAIRLVSETQHTI